MLMKMEYEWTECEVQGVKVFNFHSVYYYTPSTFFQLQPVYAEENN